MVLYDRIAKRNLFFRKKIFFILYIFLFVIFEYFGLAGRIFEVHWLFLCVAFFADDLIDFNFTGKILLYIFGSFYCGLISVYYAGIPAAFFLISIIFLFIVFMGVNQMDGVDGWLVSHGVIALLWVIIGKESEFNYAWLKSDLSAIVFILVAMLNIGPRVLFLGEAGAGLLAGFIGTEILRGWLEGDLVYAIGFVCIFSFAACDVVLTAGLRYLRLGVRSFECHQDHFYQRLVIDSKDRLRAFKFFWLVLIPSFVIAFVAFKNQPELILIICLVIISISILFLRYRLIRERHIEQ